MSWARRVERIGQKENAYNILVGGTEGKSTLGKFRHRSEDRTKVDLGDSVWEDVNWIHLRQEKINGGGELCEHADV
jgi:hypothetical protein